MAESITEGTLKQWSKRLSVLMLLFERYGWGMAEREAQKSETTSSKTKRSQL